jgi:hypothetical protein
MRTVWASFLILCVAACAVSPPANGPSAELLAMRNQFEREVLAIEKDHPGDAEGLRQAAMPIALKIYGANWEIVRAEAKRSLAALAEIDLAAYEKATPIPSNIDPTSLREMTPFLTPAGTAMMHFWDAQAVGFMIAPMSVDLMRDGDSAMMIGTKMSLVPNRVWRGKFNGKDVLASRYLRSMVIAPYTFTAQGMILPSFDELRVYDLQAG